jgi:hypothetical protein
MEKVVVDSARNHIGTNPKQFGNCLCKWWKGLLEQNDPILIEVRRLYVWPIEHQTSWGTCWSFPKVFTYATNIFSCELLKQT